MGTEAKTMVGGHAEQAERLRDSGTYGGMFDRPPYSGTAVSREDHLADARWLARTAAQWARNSLWQLSTQPAEAALSAAAAQSLALASLALMKAYAQ